jgi:cell division protein FtsB
VIRDRDEKEELEAIIRSLRDEVARLKAEIARLRSEREERPPHYL